MTNVRSFSTAMLRSMLRDVSGFSLPPRHGADRLTGLQLQLQEYVLVRSSGVTVSDAVGLVFERPGLRLR